VIRSAPLRFFVLWTMVLLVAAAMASSAAHAVVLGEASARSALGQPLRVTIPLTAAPGETVAAECFGLERLAVEGFAAPVTAKVSLERLAAAERLVVTSVEPIAEPVLRLTLRAGCEAGARRDYVLLLDPPSANVTTIPAAAAGVNARPVRETGQDRPVGLLAAARRDLPEGSGTGTPRVQRPAGAEASSAPALRHASLNADEARARPQGKLLPAAAVSERVRVVPPAPRSGAQPVDRTKDTWWTIVVAVSGFAVILLGAALVRHGRAAPKTYAPGAAGGTVRERSPAISRRSGAATTIANANAPTDALLTRAAPSTRGWVSPATAPTVPNVRATTSRMNSRPMPGARARPAHAGGAHDDALDSLLNEIESNLNVEDAVRQAHAAVHGNPGGDIGCDAILQAIEDAERHLMLAPSAPVDPGLDDDIIGKPRRREKAA
jgi:hypothetical protein